ncbi:MAG TPA: response regulator [Phnomibacter sp.]|nr:response regulator [Phnomibacter sp.]
MGLRIAIVEDDFIIAEAIQVMLEDLGYQVCWQAARYGEAINKLDEHLPDLLLLDIQLSGKLDGISLARQVMEQYGLPYIFITANADALTIERAKYVQPMAYLTKPITKSLLYSAIEIALTNYAQFTRTVPVPVPSYKGRDFIFIKENQGYSKIFFAQIVYLQSEGNYVHLRLTDGKQKLVRATLPDLLKQLDDSVFMRIHRSYVVNINYLERLMADEIRVAGQVVPLSKSYREELHQKLGISNER